MPSGMGSKYPLVAILFLWLTCFQTAPSRFTVRTNLAPTIHSPFIAHSDHTQLDKKPKKAAKEEDEDDAAYKAKQIAGLCYPPPTYTLLIISDLFLQTRRPARRWPRRLAARAP